MMANHTPGEWQVFEGICDPYVAVVRDDGSMRVLAECLTEYQQPIDEARANARLIAAAPKLLEALQALVDTIEDIQLQYVEGYKGEGFDIEWEIGPSKMVKAREALARTWEL